MSRQRGASSMHRVERAAQDLIARRVPAKAGELLELIHAINPTGRSLGAADERRRYELKARLQSLLIRNFAEDLIVTVDVPGAVSIRHRYLGQDACHARIDELDDDARARVRWMLDAGEAVEPRGGMAIPPAAGAVAATDPLEQGRRALAEFDDEAARAHFERALQESNGDPADLRAELRRAWRVCTSAAGEQPDHHDLVGELLGRLPYAEAALPWLVPGGRELVIASAEGPHLFLGCVSVDDGRVRERRYLRAPAAMGELISATVDGDALWLIGDAGRVLQVSLEAGEPVRWLSLDPFLIGAERIERGFVAAGGKHLWLEVSLPGCAPQDRVIEIEPGRLRRELPAARSFQPLVAGSSSGVIGTGLHGGAVRYTERGAVVEEIAASASMQVSEVVIDPDRELVVVGSQLDGTGEIEIMRTRAGRAIHRRTLIATSSDAAHRCVSARDPGLLAVHHHVEQDDVEQDDVEQDDVEQDHIAHRGVQLVVFRFADPELVPVYTTPAPWDLVLAQDADAAQAVCLWDSSRRVEIERLGSQPPAFGDAIGLHAQWRTPVLDGHFSCGTAASDAGGTALLSAANHAANRGDWREVRTLLEGVPPDSVAPDWLAHHCHLLGIAWLRTGAETTRARELFQLGWSREPAVDRLFKCRLDVCLELVEPLPDPLPDEWWGPGASLVRQLRGAIASADRLTAAGQPGAALEVMRRRAVTGNEEVQSAARLAAAWLAVAPHGTSDRFSAAIALARFVRLAVARAPGPPALDLPIEGAWSRDQLTSLAERAEQWLAAWREPG